jgi:hypothetical protein
MTMQPNLIRYETKPGMAAENAKLIENVFAELHDAAPAGVRYLVLQTDDNSFFHLVLSEDSSGLTSLPAFAAFQEGGDTRRTGTPKRSDVTIIGNYRMLAE